MKVNDTVKLFSHAGFLRLITLVSVGVPNSLNEQPSCITSEGSAFYMEPESGSGKHYNVGNKAFWISTQ